MHNKRNFRHVKLLAIIVFVIILLSNSVVFAKDIVFSSYVEEQYNEDDGLPTGESNCIIQTSIGYIWIGSYGGLIRYDGSNFVDYTNKLSTAAVRALFEDSKGNMYIGSNESGAYLFANDQFIHLEVNGSATSFSCVRFFAESNDGVVYVASHSGIGYIKDNVIQPIVFDNPNAEQIVGLAFDKYNHLWALGGSGPIFVFDNNNLVATYPASEFFVGGYPTSISSIENNKVCIGSVNSEIIVFEPSSTITNDSSKLISNIYSTGDIKTINDIVYTKDHKLLICGLSGFGYFNEKFELNLVDSRSISANNAIMDYEGNLWVASSSLGVIRYSLGCYNIFKTDDSLNTTWVNAVHKEGNYYYVGTDDGLLMYDENQKSVTNDLTTLLSTTRVRNITSDIYGNVWFATYAGAVKYNSKTNEIKKIDVNEGLQSDKVRVVYGLSDGKVLIGNQLGAAIVSNDIVIETYGGNDGIENPSVLCACEVGGKVLIGTDGSGIYEIKSGSVIHYADNTPLSESVILRIRPDSDDNSKFFVCSSDTLFYYDGSSFIKLNNFKKGSGSFYEIYDVDGKVWILQNAGIICIDKNELLNNLDDNVYSITYGIKCGLSGSLSANTWNYLSEDGSLYLATRYGISIFYFKGVEATYPSTVVNSVQIDNTYYEHPTSVYVSRNAQRVTIDISSLCFSDTNVYYLSYQLEGFDDVTIVENKHTDVTYTNLPGGKYVFKVNVIDPKSGNNYLSVQMNIEVQKKLTEYPLFWVTVFVVTIGLSVAIAFFVNDLRIKKIKKHQEELKNMTEEALLTVSRTIDAKDDYTKGHSIRVAIYSREIAKRMGLSDEEQEKIYYIALLHDIGKIGVPDDILNKKGRLTDEERAVIQKHPLIGGEILQDFKALPGISEGAKYHHERYDGTGYGEKLAAESIPLVARIIGIADSYDAMQSTRCYRPALTTDVIISELRKGAGTQFDPKLVQYMLDMIEDGTAPAKI